MPGKRARPVRREAARKRTCSQAPRRAAHPVPAVLVVDVQAWGHGVGDHPGPEHPGGGTVNLLKLSGGTGMVGSGASVCEGNQAAVTVPVTSFQMVNRSAISRRYSSAPSRWRPGRKCGDIPLKADKNRWACPGEVNRFMARSRCRVGWWEFPPGYSSRCHVSFTIGI